MLLKNSSANQEAVQAKRRQKKKEAAERVGKRGGKLQCVCECSFYSSSEHIFINFQAFGVAFDWVFARVYMAENRGRQ